MTSASSYSPMAAQQPQCPPPRNVTFWDLFVDAAKAQYGASIQVVDTQIARNRLNYLDFEISIISADPSPTEVRRATVDITTKEFTNHCEKEVDETLVKVRKSNLGWTGSRYHFSTTRGGNYGIGGDIGPKVIHLAIAGGSTTINASIANLITLKEEHNFDFNYFHEEKISVPPQSRVKARITSYSVNYEQGYTILFSIPASVVIPVTYKTGCLGFVCSKAGYISVAQLCSTLPDYHFNNGLVSFVQCGALSWIGEASSIDKDVETL